MARSGDRADEAGGDARGPGGLALADRRDGHELCGAGVFGEGAVEAVVFELLEDLCGPTGGPSDGEDGSEEVGGNFQRVVNGGGVEIDVGVEAFLLAHEFGDALGHLDPLWLTEFFGEFDGHFLKVGGAGIEGLVDAVADAHDLFFVREAVFDEGVDFIEGANFFEHLDDSFVGAAVEGAFEGADGRGDRGVKIGEGGDGDAGREGGGVHAVVGVDNVGDVEGFDGGCAGLLAVHEVEEVGGFGEIVADGGKVFALAGAVEVGDDHWDLRTDGEGDLAVGVLVGLTGLGALVVEAKHGDAGADDVHGVGIFGGGLEEVDDALGDGAVVAQGAFHDGEFLGVGEFAFVEEIEDFFVAAMLDEVVDFVAEVGKFAGGTLDVGECGFIGDDAFEAFCVV